MQHLRPTRSVLDIARRLEAAGFEAWCVGGAIRDALLGGHPLDWDLATQAHPEFLSRPTRPHPLFSGLIAAALERSRVKPSGQSLPAVAGGRSVASA